MHKTNKFVAVSAFLALIAVLVLYPGCKSDSSGPDGGATGSLTIAIVGLPGGLNANVVVTGPNSFNQVVTATQTLSNLTAGTYTVTANNVATAATIVSELYHDTTTGTTVSVTANATALDSVKYVVRGGSGKLWVPLSAQSLSGYSPAQLVVNGSPVPGVSVGTGVFTDAIAFDKTGSMWVTTFSGNKVVKYTASQLATSGIPTPAVSITANATSLSSCLALAFAPNGDLWVANFGNSTLVKFTVAQLAVTGSPAPSVIIGGAALSNIIGIAFDANGNLWVVSRGTSTIVKFTPAQLVSTGTPTPDVTITGPAAEGLAFDSNGNLWASVGGANTLVMFTPAQLAGSGTPTPTVTISASGGSLAYPRGLAFDNSGNLWVVSLTGTKIVQFSAAQLVASGSPAPVVTISGLGSIDAALLAFNPTPGNLPIYK